LALATVVGPARNHKQLSLKVGSGFIIGLPMRLLMAATVARAFWAESNDQPVLMTARHYRR